MATTKARALGFVAALAFAGCGSQSELASEAEPTADFAASTVDVPASTTTSTTTTTEAVAETFLVDPTLPLISYWASNESDGQPPSLRYAMASSARLDDLWEQGGGVRIVMPFGVPPSVNSIVRVWSAGADRAANPGPHSIWPVECVGLRPDADGDSLVDDCDPFPNDGPLADFDGDGVINGEDNCPATANPDQFDLSDRFGGDACAADENEGNRARIIFATMTVDDMNVQRAAKGLGPIEWPVVNPVRLPQVEEWCASLRRLSDDAELAVVDEVFASVPDVYGFTDTDIATMRALLAEIYPYLDSVESDDESEQAELRRLSAQFAPYTLIFDTTDQSC